MNIIRYLFIIFVLTCLVSCQTGKSVVRVLQNTNWKAGTMQDVLNRAQQVEAIYFSADLYGRFEKDDLEIGFESSLKVKMIMSDLAKAKYVKHDEWRGQALAFRFRDGTGIYVIALPDDRGFFYGPYYESPELYKRFEEWGLIHKN